MVQVEENLTGELIKTYESLLELQKEKRKILEHHEIDKLGGVDEKILSMYNKALGISDKKALVKPNDMEKKKIRELYSEISKLANFNQTLVTYSLNIINNIFSGIMKIASLRTTEYGKDGKNIMSDESVMSSVIEEA